MAGPAVSTASGVNTAWSPRGARAGIPNSTVGATVVPPVVRGKVFADIADTLHGLPGTTIGGGAATVGVTTPGGWDH